MRVIPKESSVMIGTRPARLVVAAFVALLCALAAADAASAQAVPRFSSGVTPEVGANPFRMIAADLNADGNPDLATVDWTSATVSVLLGKGNGSFGARTSYRTAPRPAGLTAADVDRDGRLDLISASTNRAGSISVFSNRGSGRFRRTSTYAVGSTAYAVAAADVSQDGVVDLVTAHASRRNEFAVLLGTGAGRFAVAHRYSGLGATDVAVGDLNRDGKPDVALAARDSNSVAVRLGLGGGSFGAAQLYKSGAGTFGVTLADLNHDEILDIAAANYDGGSFSVFLGAGDGGFGARSRYRMGWVPKFVTDVDTVVVADFDHDGHLDIATPEFDRPMIRRGRGDGTFESQQEVSEGAASTIGGAVADFNRDGWPDLAFSNACDEVELDCDEFPRSSAFVFLNWTGQSAPPCVVPDIIREELPAAGRELERAGCRLGRVRYSGKIRVGRVIRQRPADGAVLPNSSAVDVDVSRGRGA
jgi:hypothetical protein